MACRNAHAILYVAGIDRNAVELSFVRDVTRYGNINAISYVREEDGTKKGMCFRRYGSEDA
eukprot:10269751-Alexandrium_andersonii.AAC.1